MFDTSGGRLFRRDEKVNELFLCFGVRCKPDKRLLSCTNTNI